MLGFLCRGHVEVCLQGTGRQFVDIEVGEGFRRAVKIDGAAAESVGFLGAAANESGDALPRATTIDCAPITAFDFTRVNVGGREG